MAAGAGEPREGALARNRTLYDHLWRYVDPFPHDGWSAWSEIAPFVAAEGARVLEIGPGKFPHVPPDRAWFADLSMSALRVLRDRGGRCVAAASPLPFADATFDVVCLFEVLEHVDDDAGLVAELARVLKPDGKLFLSCPMNPAYWTDYDRVIGHVRRYGAAGLTDLLSAHGLVIERVCARHDRMDRWFGWLFGFGVRYVTWLTTKIVMLLLPRVAAMPWPWSDGASLDEAERKGGVTVRARHR